jgi:hypothetical protein
MDNKNQNISQQNQQRIIVKSLNDVPPNFCGTIIVTNKINYQIKQ